MTANVPQTALAVVAARLTHTLAVSNVDPLENSMKARLLISALMVCGFASAQGLPTATTAVTHGLSSVAGSSVFESKGRTGSKRVGGSGKSGKGGRYVGGRK